MIHLADNDFFFLIQNQKVWQSGWKDKGIDIVNK